MGRAKIINYDNNTRENMSQYNRKWSQIPNHPYRILIIGGLLITMIKQKHDDDYSITDKTYLYIEDPNETKY